MLTHLDHVIVAVRDLETATRDYAELLGREPAWCGEHPGAGTENRLFPLSNATLELLCPVGEGPFATPLRDWLDRHGEGLAGLAFGTEDAAACARALRERGLPAADPSPGAGRDPQSGATRDFENVFLPGEATRGVPIFAVSYGETAPLTPGKETAAPASCLDALDHVVVESRDLAAAARLFEDGLGLRLALDREFAARGLRILFFRIAGVTLEVVGPPRAPGSSEPHASDRLHGLAFRAEDVAAAQARIARAGFDVSEVRTGFKPGTRVCTVRDRTHGVPTLLIGPDAAKR